MEASQQTTHYKFLISKRKSDLSERLALILNPPRTFVWEVGCGHGHFMTAFAEAYPKKLCIGVDMESKRIERALRKRDRAGLSNLHFIHGDARLFLEALPTGSTLAEIFVLFPDPWPKLRHRKHRILQPDFLSSVADRAADNARLYFRTDFQPYFTDACATIRQHSKWMIVDEPWPFEHETVFQNRAAGYQSLVARRRP